MLLNQQSRQEEAQQATAQRAVEQTKRLEAAQATKQAQQEEARYQAMVAERAKQAQMEEMRAQAEAERAKQSADSIARQSEAARGEEVDQQSHNQTLSKEKLREQYRDSAYLPGTEWYGKGPITIKLKHVELRMPLGAGYKLAENFHGLYLRVHPEFWKSQGILSSDSYHYSEEEVEDELRYGITLSIALLTRYP